MLVSLLFCGLALGQVDTGDADFSRYVGMGDSFGMAVVNASIHGDAQANSISALIAQRATGSSDGFEQPLVSDPGIPPVLQLRSISPLRLAPKPGRGAPINLSLPRPYDNMSVSGADTFDVLHTVTDNGGAHDLVLRGLGTQLEQALALQPTFVSIWIGGNDFLGAAVSGLVVDGVTLTTVETFEQNYRAIVGALAANVPGVIVGTLPTDLRVAAFLTAIPPFVVDPATGRPVEINGQRIPLIGPNGPMQPDEFVLLTATGQLAAGIGIPVALGGTGQPLADSVTLVSAEASAIHQRVSAFNEIIRTAAADFNVAVADIEGLMNGWAAHGQTIGGIEYTTAYLRGGIFSLDGVHLAPIGYAMMANSYIAAINGFYSAQVPLVSLGPFVTEAVGRYPGGTAFPVATSRARITRQAIKNLKWTLGVPSAKKIRRLAAKQTD